MPTPNLTTNTFYIAANIIFDLANGETKNVLMLVNKKEDATIFNAADTQKYINFVQQRAKGGIIWSTEQLMPPVPTGRPAERHAARFIIRGVQYAV
jgi:hypothetical protein